MLRPWFKFARMALALWLLLGVLAVGATRGDLDRDWIEWLIFWPAMLWLWSWLIHWALRQIDPEL